MKISINGNVEKYNNPLSLSELLEALRLEGKKIAIECNGEIVPRGVHASTLLRDGDRLEIVVAVGGG
ncbi:MAG TPA: sulfur carrier protein ThiS [Burkholderiales bacterium]|nr:sulfur carrier protein ThiS [Burkholderiales bacterium]